MSEHITQGQGLGTWQRRAQNASAHPGSLAVLAVTGPDPGKQAAMHVVDRQCRLAVRPPPGLTSLALEPALVLSTSLFCWAVRLSTLGSAASAVSRLSSCHKRASFFQSFLLPGLSLHQNR